MQSVNSKEIGTQYYAISMWKWQTITSQTLTKPQKSSQ